MSEYHKIHTVFKRDLQSRTKDIIEGEYSRPEFEYLANNAWTFTEKVDGTNIRVILKDGTVTFGGRTDAASIPANLVSRLNERFLTVSARQKFAAAFPDGAVLYGEGYGPKIQKGGGLYRKDQDFVLFDIRVGRWWLLRPAVEDVAKCLGIDIVPIVGEGTIKDAVEKVRGGLTSAWGNFQAEGLVLRPKTELLTRGGDRIITKIKGRDFKCNEEAKP